MAKPAEKTVETYIAALEPSMQEVVKAIRELVREAAPNAKESIKWAQPVYEHNGPFAYIKAFKGYVNFGFWRGVDIPDPESLLQGSGDRMRHLKIASTRDIRKPALQAMVRYAVRLNETKGDPTKGS